MADDYRDVVYNTGMTSKNNIGTVGGGQWFTNGNSHDFTFNGETLSLTVYSEISNAVTALSIDNNNTVMAHIGRLREKLKEPAKNPKFVKTVWGVGYIDE